MARAGGRDRGLFQRNGDWWIRWTCPYGHEHREKIGPKSLARELYQRRKVAVKTVDFCLTAERERQQREQATLFQAVAEKYLDWARDHRPRSYTYRRTALTHLVPAFGTKPLREISRSDVENYLKERRKTHGKSATINRERQVLSHLFNKAKGWGLTDTNPVVETEALPENNEAPRPLTSDEEARLFEVLPENLKPLILLALNTGMRLNELRTQLWRDVDLGDGTLTVTMPKSKQHEVLPLNSMAFAVLAGLEQRDPRLFPQMPKKMSDVFIRHAKKAELVGVTFHCLRDTYISRLAPHCNTPTLMALARHRDYKTTRRYIKIDGEHLRYAVEALVPPADDIATDRDHATQTGTPTGTDFYESL